jgi:hypothetical protein
MVFAPLRQFVEKLTPTQPSRYAEKMPFHIIRTNPFTMESCVCFQSESQEEALTHAIQLQSESMTKSGMNMSYLDLSHPTQNTLLSLTQCLDFETIVHFQQKGGRFKYSQLFVYSVSEPKWINTQTA